MILIVEDDEIIRDVMAESLTDEGFDVRVAPNGQEAVELLATVRPDLIVIDWRMPVMTGEEVVAWLRADPSLATIPLVVLSAARPREVSVTDAMVLQKPVNLETLSKVVHELTKRPG